MTEQPPTGPQPPWPAWPPQLPYGAPYAQPYPPPYGQPQMYQQPIVHLYVLPVREVGVAVTKPAWTCGDLILAWTIIGIPIVWLRRRRRTTVTRHR